jgi:hypothetical protein
MVEQSNDPIDYEMLGACHRVLDNGDAARDAFKLGLNIERERNPASELCGNLMRRLSEI